MYCSKLCRGRAWHQANAEQEKVRYANRDRVQINLVAALYREKNRDSINAKLRQWGQNNREKKIAHNVIRRARMAGAESFAISLRELNRILASPCAYCGMPGGTLDHVIPLTRGGRHSLGNLAPACKKCNSSKKNSTVMEWRIRLRRVESFRKSKNGTI